MLRPFLIMLSLSLSLLLTWQVGKHAQDWRLQQLQSEGEDRLLHLVIELRSALSAYEYLPFMVSQNRAVRELLLYADVARDKEREADVSLFLEQTNLIANSSALFVLDRQGRALAHSYWRDQQDFYLQPHHEQPYFTQARQGERGSFFTLYDINQQPAYYLSAPIYLGPEFMGVAVVKVNMSHLASKLRSEGNYVFSTPQGIVMLATLPNWSQQALDNLLQGRQLQTLSNGVRAQLWQLTEGQQLVQSVTLDDLHWTLSVLSPTLPAHRTGQTLSLFTLGSCLALALLSLYLRERRLKHRSQQETRAVQARNEVQQRSIISKAQVGLITLNQQGEMLFVNPMALQQFGLSPSLARHLRLHQLLLEPWPGAISLALHSLQQPPFRAVRAQEALGRRADGSQFPMLFSLQPMPAMPEPTYLATIIDISRRKRLESALRDANESLEQKVRERTQALETAQAELVQAGKMAALGRMSTAMVHELNQPLTAMRTYIAICRQLLQQPEQLAPQLALLDQLTDRMAAITSQLKSFAYQKPDQLRPVALATSLQRVLKQFQPRLQEQGVEVSVQGCEQSLLAEPHRLEQVLSNLLVNALDAMQGQASPACLQISGECLSPQLFALEVHDSGPGIDEQARSQIFDPFYTSKPLGQGLGLGLAIVSSIMRDLGGQISLLPQPGPLGGASFQLILQREPEDE
ncbi:ATP-binding protein [Balneatrix alpica]|uniref:ATP-binding protein n=1 Tax=Balneatrix alpica TaxID=75684 RepID=UPI0027393815|nr:ATP-binding protein [Balneatrix alpica]